MAKSLAQNEPWMTKALFKSGKNFNFTNGVAVNHLIIQIVSDLCTIGTCITDSNAKLRKNIKEYKNNTKQTRKVYKELTGKVIDKTSICL